MNKHHRLLYPPYPTVGRPRCFMRFFTSSDSSCRSERRYRLSLCCEMRSALLDGLVLFLLSRRAHCMLFFLSSGCSDWSLVVEFLWAVFSFQDSPRLRCSVPCSTLMDSWDWESRAVVLTRDTRCNSAVWPYFTAIPVCMAIKALWPWSLHVNQRQKNASKVFFISTKGDGRLKHDKQTHLTCA